MEGSGKGRAMVAARGEVWERSKCRIGYAGRQGWDSAAFSGGIWIHVWLFGFLAFGPGLNLVLNLTITPSVYL